MTAIEVMLVLTGVAIIVDMLERLSTLEVYRGNGVLSDRVVGTRPTSSATLRTVRRLIVDAPKLRKIFLARLTLAVVLLVPGLDDRARGGVLAIMLVLALLTGYRCQYGSDGSDQMELVVLAGLAAAFVLRPEGLEWVGLWFIALQSLLSYATAGVAKLLSPTWRSGQAVALIFSTKSYGYAFLAQLSRRTPAIPFLLAWFVIALECGFVLTLVLPWSALVVVLALGLALHLGIAVTMGLNKFLLMWLATYPAIVLCAQQVHAAL